MRIISRRSIIEFGVKHKDCLDELLDWFNTIRKADWQTPHDFKKVFSSCVILPNNRVIFHIKGNHYRLIVFINYAYQRMYIKFVGTYAEYDKIDAHTINQF